VPRGRARAPTPTRPTSQPRTGPHPPAHPGPTPQRALAIYPERKLVEAASDDGIRFFVGYDKLAVCTGSQVRAPT
jgi:NADPH-dependent 2,4-dienoyl-CoA reductase/sulfur reductase-like enzyme